MKSRTKDIFIILGVPFVVVALLFATTILTTDNKFHHIAKLAPQTATIALAETTPPITGLQPSKPAKAPKKRKQTARKSSHDCLLMYDGHGSFTPTDEHGQPCKEKDLKILPGDVPLFDGDSVGDITDPCEKNVTGCGDVRPAKPHFDPPPPFDNLGEI